MALRDSIPGIAYMGLISAEERVRKARREANEAESLMLYALAAELGRNKDLLAWSPDWVCDTSPIEHCVYDEDYDPSHDNCIFCHEPKRGSSHV